jgi:hypothetical protein
MADSIKDVSRGSENAAVKGLLPSWFRVYVETNRDFPMAPAATDTAIGGAMVESLMLNRISIEQIASSELDERQTAALSRIVADAHAQYGVKAMPGEFATEGSVPFATDKFHEGWKDIKERVFMAISVYIGSLDIELKPDTDNLIGKKNISVLHQFFNNPEYQSYVDALCDMYSAANDVFKSDKYKALGDQQKMMYSGSHASGFKVTEPLSGLISDIDASVTAEWKKRHQKHVPQNAKEAFVDVITRRRDQPLR